jgi:hypothetical protein
MQKIGNGKIIESATGTSKSIDSDYIIQDTDTDIYYLVDTTSGDVTITLPLLGNNDGKRVKIIYVAGSNNVIISANVTDANKIFTDALDDIKLSKKDNFVELLADTTSDYWLSISEAITSQLFLNTHAGYGSTDNKIVRYTNSIENIGTGTGGMFSENHSTGYSGNTEGIEITINRSGKYAFSVTHDNRLTTGNGGLSLNSSQLTTIIASINVADRIAYEGLTSANSHPNSSWVGYLSKGDIVRSHGDGNTPSVAARESFAATYLGQ